MNFRRIEWIFLLAFVVLDIFLGFMFVQTSSKSTQTTGDTATTIIREMRADNISFKNPDTSEGRVTILRAVTRVVSNNC
ncbi:two-component system regulatory protein YycI [Lactiplantibacillus plantarum]|uniref:hypothetical protein n=1 Tax=Lactiplantibacillus plantarum TaxID=1590 RepID=UPI0021CB2767|nr:hypothetical protein [Lactiplantibacillus plantarum]